MKGQKSTTKIQTVLIYKIPDIKIVIILETEVVFCPFEK
jgi:hypothetical protein